MNNFTAGDKVVDLTEITSDRAWVEFEGEVIDVQGCMVRVRYKSGNKIWKPYTDLTTPRALAISNLGEAAIICTSSVADANSPSVSLTFKTVEERDSFMAALTTAAEEEGSAIIERVNRGLTGRFAVLQQLMRQHGKTEKD